MRGWYFIIGAVFGLFLLLGSWFYPIETRYYNPVRDFGLFVGSGVFVSSVFYGVVCVIRYVGKKGGSLMRSRDFLLGGVLGLFLWLGVWLGVLSGGVAVEFVPLIPLLWYAGLSLLIGSGVYSAVWAVVWVVRRILRKKE